MRLHRFNEAKSVSSAPNEVLIPFGLTTKDLDRLLDVLEKNALDANLLQDLKKFSNADYRNLRAWNVKILKKGIDRVQSKLDEIDLVEDYLIDLIDDGYKVVVNPIKKSVYIYFDPKKYLKGVFDISKNLMHTLNSNRLVLVVVDIKKSSDITDMLFFIVKYGVPNLPGEAPSTDTISKMLNDVVTISEDEDYEEDDDDYGDMDDYEDDDYLASR